MCAALLLASPTRRSAAAGVRAASIRVVRAGRLLSVCVVVLVLGDKDVALLPSAGPGGDGELLVPLRVRARYLCRQSTPVLCRVCSMPLSTACRPALWSSLALAMAVCPPS
jgi:hypothetical protein